MDDTNSFGSLLLSLIIDTSDDNLKSDIFATSAKKLFYKTERKDLFTPCHCPKAMEV